MPDLTRFSVLFGGLLLVGVIMLALRWTWGPDRTLPTARLTDPDDPTGLGLLVEASRVPDPTYLRLADELMAAYRREGEAMTKRENTIKMAESNKAFAHFAW